MKLFLTAIVVLMASAAVAQQPQADAAMARMRDAMKKLTQRIAEADAATATAQAAQLAAEAKTKELDTKITDFTRNLKDEVTKGKAEKENSDKTIKDLESKLAAKEKENTALTESLTKWKDYAGKAEKVANAKEGELSTAAGRVIVMERQITEHERKNREMYKLGVEILDRYKSFGLGTALLAREPFVGSMRVKFQNYVQDYGDKLDAQRIKPGAGKVVEASPPASTGKASKP